ncbi:MYXO-CTERM sorting domain-containing protein [Polyangium aurulentum]|uniref:MYXO-CTERM sorting domain-containing protein n=1 Tax=Polyangium aurulentum TaxID=2567896 RepID=UPI0010ADE343|nr:MYXO-CTERM sorting domain-containing protein [Polyangium aurulentum]UQA58354.1 DUF11 domain-containing protein [Polyangium aurulentum]
MSPRSPLLLALTLAALVPASASAQELRFTATVPGGITGTGNTLGLAKATNLNGPGDRDSIGTFLSLGDSVDDMPVNAANPWPMGTTFDWKANGSAAMLDLPEAEVLYAELLWGGSYNYGGEDVTSALNSPVKLFANGESIDVMPDPNTALTIAETAMSGFAVNYYMRSANVTDFVKLAGKGSYEVRGVPATQATSINSLNAAGWTLVVAYRDEGAATRNLSVFVGGSFVDEDTQQDYAVSGFCAPPAGLVEGTVIVSAIEGDANLVGDKLRIAPSAAGPFVDLSGPNNPANNFFCSQINDAAGNLDTQGTLGTKNHDAVGGKNVVGARQGWDVTTVPLSSAKGQLVNGQTGATIRTITTGDSFAPVLAAFAIDVNAPDFTGGASASDVVAPAEVTLGETFTVEATLSNGGEVTAQEVSFTLPLDPGLSLVSFTTDGNAGDIGGNPVDAAALAAGVDVGSLASGGTRKVALELKVAAPPQLTGYFLKARWAYGFEVCSNQALVPESFSRSTFVQFKDSGGGVGGAGGGNGGAGGGNGGAGGGNGGAGGGNGDTGGAGGASSGGNGDSGESGGCACSTPGREGSGHAAAALGLLGLAAVVLRGRRR